MKVALISCLSVALFGYVYSSPLQVVNGDEVVPNSIPSQAHLYFETDFGQSKNCSGVLITGRYVLTTSKCEWSGPTRVNVTLGVHNVRKPEGSQQVLVSRRNWKVYNVDFQYNSLENNIGLVKLPTTVTLNDDIQVAKLAETDNITVGQTGIISGWGGQLSIKETTLQSATVTVVNNSVCANAYPTAYIGPKVFCVQGSGSASACYGDGGAPLVIDGEVVGVFSGGPVYIDDDAFRGDCSGKPNIFTKIASFIDWVKDNSDYDL